MVQLVCTSDQRHHTNPLDTSASNHNPLCLPQQPISTLLMTFSSNQNALNNCSLSDNWTRLCQTECFSLLNEQVAVMRRLTFNKRAFKALLNGPSARYQGPTDSFPPDNMNYNLWVEGNYRISLFRFRWQLCRDHFRLELQSNNVHCFNFIIWGTCSNSLHHVLY